MQPKKTKKVNYTLSNPNLNTSKHRSFRKVPTLDLSTIPQPPLFDSHDDSEPGELPATVEVTPILNIPYIHGGYAAVAPIMLEDPKWMNILRRLMPYSHQEIVHKMFIGKTFDEPEFDFTP